MSFVADFVEDVFDLVEDVAKGAVKVVKSVVKTVVDVVKAAVKDPITTISKVAAYATGNAWAIPLIDGASTIAKGGSIGDGIKAAAISYGTGKIGTAVGKAAGQYATSVGAQASTSKLVENIVTSGASRATVAIVTNQDPVKAFLTGGVTAATGAILGKVQGFNEQPSWVRNTVSATVAAAVTGNKDVLTQTVANEIVIASGIVTKALSTFDPNNKMTESQRLIAADAIFRTTSAAIAGKSPDAALTQSLTNAAVKALGEYAKEGIATVSNSLASAYAKVTGTGDKLDAIATKASAATNQYNSVSNSLNAAIKEQDRLKAVMDAAVKKHNAASDNTHLAAANKAVDGYEEYVTSLNKSYNEYYKPELDRLVKELTTYDKQYQDLTGVLKKDQGVLQAEIDKLTKTLDPIYANSNRAFAEALLPGFDAEAYRKLNPNIPKDADPYLHYIAEGQFQGLKGTQEQLTQVRTDFANKQIEADFKEFVYDGSKAKTQAQAEAEAKAQGYNTYTFGGKTNTIIPPAELEARNKLLQQVLQTEGKTISTATDADIRKAVDIVNNVPQQKVLDGISIQDVLNGNYSGWRDGKYLTHFNTKDGKGTATFDPKTGTYTMDAVIVTANRIEKKNVSTGSLQDLASMDPEAYLQMASQFDAKAKGDFGDFFTNSLNAAVLAAHATGNKTLANNLQQTLALGSQGIGEQVQNIAKFIASVSGMSYDNAAVRAGKAMQEWGAANQSASTKAQEEAIIKAVESAKGVGNKLGAFFKTGANNFGGALTLIAKEGVQEILPLWAARGVMTAGKLIAYSTNAAIEGIESWGSNAGEVYETAIKQGRSEDEARAMASKVGFQSFVVTSVTNGIGDIPVVRKIIGDGVSASFGDILKGSGREAVTEYFDELLTNANNQRALYGTVNWDYATTAATIGAGIGAGTTAGILTGMSFNPNAVVAKDVNGKNVTLTEFLEGTKNVNMSTVNMNTSIGTTKSGNTVTLGTTLAMPMVSGVSYSTVTAGVPSILQNQNIVVGKDAFGNNLTLANLMGQVNKDNSFESVYKANATSTIEQRTEAQKKLIEQSFKDAGYTTFTAKDVESLLNVNNPGGTQSFVSSAQTYAAPRVTTAAEARQFLLDSGYRNPTQAEINQFVGSVSDNESKRLVAEYVAPRMVTEADARAFFAARNYTPTKAEIDQFVRQGADVRKTQVEQELGAYVDPRQVTKEEAKQFFESLGYRPTDAEIAQFVKQGPDVQQSIVQQLLGEYVDPRMVTTEEARKAFEALGFNEATQSDLERLSGQYAQEELAGRTKDFLPTAMYNATTQRIKDTEASILKRVNELEASGMRRDQALETAINQVATDLGTTRDALLSEIGSVEESLGTQIRDTRTELTGQIQTVADLLGKPARQVTQADIDLVTQMLADQQTDLAYDANQDGKVDQSDIDFMTRLMAGNVDQPWTPAAGTAWAPTGLYAQQAEQAEIARQEQAKQAEQARRLQLQGQMRQGLQGIMQFLPQAAQMAETRVKPIYSQTQYANFQAPLFQTNLWGQQPAPQNPTSPPNQFRMASGGYLEPQGEPQTWEDIYRMLK